MSTAIDLIRGAQGQNATADAGDSGDSAVQKWLDDAADMGPARLDEYARCEDFYEGDHDVELTDRAREYLERKGVRFCENFCEPIVDMVAERLMVTGFEATIVGDEEGERGAEVSAWLESEFWTPNRLDEAQGTTHLAALVKGDSFGIVGFDNDAGRPTFDFNGPERVKVVYDEERPSRMVHAVKVWDTTAAGPSNPDGRAVCRMNVYWPDRIERYFKLHNSSGKGGWSRWQEEPSDGEPAAWPTPWVDEAGAPLGIPVIHFRNRSKGRRYGRSELAGGVLSQQLALDKQVLDLFMVLDNQGWPQRYATGVDPDQVNFKTAPGEVWTANAKDAGFGEFPTADVGPVLEAIEGTISRIARRSGMPLHLLTGGDMPSGESMKAAESRLVARVKDRSTSFGNSWEDVALLAYRLARHAQALPDGLDVDPADLTLSTLWENPASRDELAEAQTAEAHHRLGASKHTLLTKLGYDPSHEADLRKGEADEMVAVASRMFDGGNDPDEDDDR